MKIILALAAALAFSVTALAHESFKLVSSEKKTIGPSQLASLEKDQTKGTLEGSNLILTGAEIRLVILTGPEDDMLSYRIQGVRNPTLVVPSGATMRILFVNVDADMKHDVRFGHVVGTFAASPPIVGTAGSQKLMPAEGETINAEELVIRSTEDGAYKYFCSVGSHAKGGMWGNIVVGIKPGAGLKMPEKTQHVHEPGEDHPEMEPVKTVKAPHDHNDPKPKPTASPTPTGDHDMSSMAGMDHGDHKAKMSSVTNVGDPMEREASGTSWNPDSSPMYAYMKHYKDGGMLMLMGSAFLRYADVGSRRDLSVAGDGGRSRVDAPTMIMAMYSRPAGKNGQVGFRGMFSLDPAIERGYGYPLLYQSGELYRGQPIHDRQHPHDLFSELAVTYSYKVSEKQSFYVYAGLPGEPALGPPMYLHRVSGMNIPDAPIGHHWQDATHITYGVVTAGYSFGKVKFEASAFNGREPDENRSDIDTPRLNSFSGRISFNPTENWAFQVSHGYLRDPEPAEPEIRILRKTTASAIYNRPVGENKNFSGSFVWGQNYANGERSNAFLLEANYDFYENAVFGRFETVKKSGHDLVLDHPLEHDVFRLNKFSVGYIRDLYRGKGIDVGLGGMFTVNGNPAALTPVYGGTNHSGWQVFMRFRPSRHR